jgi:adenosylcobalamin-dependent ribonucleoside-triphosphate reductase
MGFATLSPRAPSVRSAILTRRTYNRPLNEEGTLFETWPETIGRVRSHQQWLWERAQGDSLSQKQAAELEELAELMLNRMVAPAGRTLWLGGTDLVKRREASNFNCAFIEVRTVHDVVDAFWLLLQGCGVGFRPTNGALSGFTRKMEVEIIRSQKKLDDPRGRDENVESYDPATKTWTISIGDSAEGWAKSLGKLVAGKFPAKKLVIDLREIRAPGRRLKGYGWICSGDNALAAALEAICGIMNKQVGKLLSKIDILDIMNWLGTVLSSRRSAQIALMDYGDPEWYAFATAKAPKTLEKNWHRSQSNNSLVFHEQPTRRQLKDLFEMIVEHGGAEPGFVNAVAALQRAAWFKGLNPCGEILLANYGFCNLVELDVARWRGDHLGMHKALRLIARANYRQTMVNLRDGILQDAWHQTNEFLRLCGVGLTGIVRRPDLTPYDFRQMRYTAISGAYEMADELGTERPKNVTTIKPSGTLSKAVFDTTEGAHRPKAKHLFNNVIFSRHDRNVERLLEANYHIFDHPNDPGAVLVRIPVCYDDVKFDQHNGHEVDRESAVSQLERYKMLQENYVDQNTSITISYDPSETKGMIDWYLKNWDSYVATSFLFRADETKTAEDLGFAYLPQEVVTKEAYEKYAGRLKPVDFDSDGSADTPLEEECASGACPIR